jgi:MFS family permease
VLSIIAVFSVVGGLTVGGLPASVADRITRPQVIITLIAAALLLMAGLTALADWSVYPAAVPVGFCLGPSFVAVYGAAGRAAAPGEQAEMQSWVASALSTGGALGTAAGGWTVQQHGHSVALAVGGLVMALGGLAGTRSGPRNRLERPPSSQRPDGQHNQPDASSRETDGVPATSVPKQ